MIKKYYYAVDKDGQGWYYDNPPITDDNGNWQGPTTNNDWMFYSPSESRDRFGNDLPELGKGERIEIRFKTIIELV